MLADYLHIGVWGCSPCRARRARSGRGPKPPGSSLLPSTQVHTLVLSMVARPCWHGGDSWWPSAQANGPHRKCSGRSSVAPASLLAPAESTIHYADVPWILPAEEPKQEELQRVVLYGGPCVRGSSRGRGWEEQRCRRVRLPAA